MNKVIRFANQKDLKATMEFDLHKNEEVISNKIDMKEVIVVELDNKVVGSSKNRVYMDSYTFYKLYSG
ncbi:hypothetical protein R2R32_07265 [Clostridium perfringens]|nr:hypothetical protein [Clostridium perfringens]